MAQVNEAQLNLHQRLHAAMGGVSYIRKEKKMPLPEPPKEQEQRT